MKEEWVSVSASDLATSFGKDFNKNLTSKSTCDCRGERVLKTNKQTKNYRFLIMCFLFTMEEDMKQDEGRGMKIECKKPDTIYISWYNFANKGLSS